MKKSFCIILVFFLALGAVYAQPAAQQPVVSPEAGRPADQNASLVSQMDNSVRILAGDVHRKLNERRAQKIAVGQFIFRGSVPPFGT